MIDYTTLNQEQQEAVFSNAEQILCLAGAGTGKTQVLTRRVARLWEQGVDPANMLALTFTRAAGAEMKERVISLIGDDGKRLFCNTFHAFCVELIRENANAAGVAQNFSIYDQAEAAELLANITESLKVKVSKTAVNDYRRGKGDRLTPAQRKDAERVIREFKYTLRSNNAIDLDGLIPAATEILAAHEEIRAKYKERYQYVFVDEFQDTDAAQWNLVNIWLRPNNLFVVGDDFQSIYQFRGSDIKIILSLADDPDWNTIKLEQNYRSTQPIVAAANALIKHNTQTEKELRTGKPGAAVELREPPNDDAEIAQIAERLEKNIAEGRTTAILARTNRQVSNARQILTARGIPTAANNAESSPFTQPEAKYLLAWLSVIENPNDEIALKRVAAIQLPKVEMLKAEKAQYSGNGTFADTLRETDAGVVLLDKIERTTREFEEETEKYSLAGAVYILRAKTGAEARHLSYCINEWQEKQVALGEPPTLPELLEWVQMSSIAEKTAQKLTADEIHLMTIHGSKGLEFDEVYIIGATQGTLPGRGNIEEERRLCYVAMTRARDLLNISSPKTMADWSGNLIPAEKSRFIAEALTE